MYAIVKTGGKQYKVAEGDVIEVEKLAGEPGDAVTLAAVLLVDGDDLVTDAAKLASVAVSGPGWHFTVKVKVLPLPRSLLTLISPPRSRQSWRHIASPRPVPP